MDLYLIPGLLQLYAKGVEDVMLTSNPTITFFKTCYKNYSFFYKEHVIIEDIMIKWNDNYLFKIPKDIQYLGPLYVKVTIPFFRIINGNNINEIEWVQNMPLKFFKSIQLMIDDDIVEKLDYDTYIIYLNYMIKIYDRTKFYKTIEIKQDIDNNIYFYLPIIHMFTLDPSYYLPVKMMNRSNIMIKFTTAKLEELVNYSNFTKNVQPIINISYDYIYMSDKNYNDIIKISPIFIYRCLYSYQSVILNTLEASTHINLYNRTIDLFLCTSVKNEYSLTYITEKKECDPWYYEYLHNTDKYNVFSTIDDEIMIKSRRFIILSNHTIISKFDIRYAMYLDEKYLQYINENLNDIDLKYSKKIALLTLYFTKIFYNKFYIKQIDFIKNIGIRLNGINLIKTLPSAYYNTVIPFVKGSILPDGYYMYSFGYKLLENQPNGMINFKFIKDIMIYSEQNVINKNIKMKICTHEYRILKIENNIGKLQ